MERRDHWEQVYSTRQAEKLGWYRPRLDTSLSWIMELDLDKDAALIDVGGGASTLVDDLIDAGFESLTVLDVADSALNAAKKRLGRQSDLVMWLPVDITAYPLPKKRFALWHDRAAFHFLTETTEQDAYCRNLEKALLPGGHVIIATFAPEAPPRCSGMPVQRYDEEQLARRLGDAFTPVRQQREMHITPAGVEQQFLYAEFRRSETQ